MSVFHTATTDKAGYLPLLKLGEPCESLLERALGSGNVHALQVGVSSLCAALVTPLGQAACELRTVVTDPEFRHQGHARRLMQTLFRLYAAKYQTMFVVATRQSEAFYRKLGFVYSHTVNSLCSCRQDGALSDSLLYLKKVLRQEKED